MMAPFSHTHVQREKRERERERERERPHERLHQYKASSSRAFIHSSVQGHHGTSSSPSPSAFFLPAATRSFAASSTSYATNCLSFLKCVCLAVPCGFAPRFVKGSVVGSAPSGAGAEEETGGAILLSLSLSREIVLSEDLVVILSDTQ